MTLKVIGTGFGRTGTDSMREALGILGFGPCHHMYEVIKNAEQKAVWRDIVKNGNPDWDQAFTGYNSCVDWPSAYYWRDLIQHFPDAKVILTWRDAESWWTSFEKTIMKGLQASTDQDSLGLALVAKKVFDGKFQDREYAIATYEANVAAVKETVPADRLLVCEIGDGWEPLCQHLGVPVPEIDYPSRNSTTQFHKSNAKS